MRLLEKEKCGYPAQRTAILVTTLWPSLAGRILQSVAWIFGDLRVQVSKRKVGQWNTLNIHALNVREVQPIKFERHKQSDKRNSPLRS